MRHVTLTLAALFVSLTTVCHSSAAEEILMRVSGEIVDATTDEPIKGAFVSAPKVEEISTVVTDDEGGFNLIIPCSGPVEILVKKEGYNSFEKILEPQSKVRLDLRLERSTNQPRVMMTEFVSRSHIKGLVENISLKAYDQYKVVVYVLTDAWYIHPFAENAEGQGFAAIKADGTWKIRTVYRGFQAYRVAFLLVDKATFTQTPVGVNSADPNGELLARIKAVAYQIIDAPGEI